MNKNLKIAIAVIIVIIMLISAILVIILNKTRDNTNENLIIEEGEEETPFDIYKEEINKVKAVTVRNDFFLVKKCIVTFYNNYLSYCNSKNDYEKVYNLLDKEYIDMFNITENNLIGEFGSYKKIDIDITNMYVIAIENNKKIYFAYGYIIDNIDSEVTDLAIEIRIDNKNNTFSVLPYKYLKEKGYLNIKEDSILEFNMEDIQNKTYNVMQTSYKDDESYVVELFETYINRNLYNPDLAYDNLEPEYAQKKFGNMQNYEAFIEKNRDLYLSYDMRNAKKYEDFENMDEYMLYLATFQQISLESYKKTTNSQYTQYVCIDNLGNYYIFRENAVMQYTVILDTYTIDLPEFVAEYEKASEEDRVLMNIQKFFEAIEDKDYDYAYDKLDATFKLNNFATLESFENYVNENFFEENTLSAGKAEKQGDVYLYNVTIDDGTGKNNNSKTTSFVMRLGEGTDFVMSFGAE